MIAYCITPIGVVVLFTVAAIIGLRRLCQFLVFAGTSGFVLRSIMRDFAKPVVRHVKRSLSAAKHLDDSLEYRTIADATQLSVLLTVCGARDGGGFYSARVQTTDTPHCRRLMRSCQCYAPSSEV